MESKKPWESKTNWVAFIMAIASFFPQFQAVVVANPETFTLAMSAVFAFLRLITKQKISIE
jgi:hypothetical protein